MSADRTSGVADQDAEQPAPDQSADRVGARRHPDIGKPPADQQVQNDGQRSGGTDSNELRSGEADSQAADVDELESTKSDGLKAAEKNYTGPFGSLDEELDARRASREYAAAHNAAHRTKIEAEGTDSRSSVEQPPEDTVADETGTVTKLAVTERESADRTSIGEEHPVTIASDHDDQLLTKPDPAPEGKSATPVDEADDQGPPETDESSPLKSDFGLPLPGEEHIPVTRAEMRARTAAANAESARERDLDRATEAIGQPTAEGAAEATDGLSATQAPDVPKPGEQYEGYSDTEQVTSRRGAPISEIRTDLVESAGQVAVWPDHAEHMRTRWADHEARWPVEDSPEGSPPDGEPPDEGVRGGSPPDRFGDEPGSWRGEGGQYLNYEENYSVRRAYDRVSASEPAVTDSIRNTEGKVEAATLVGLEYRIKGEERFKEKVAEQLAAEYREDPRRAAELTPDTLRYTYQIPAEKYTSAYHAIVEDLGRYGHDMVFSRNTWDGAEYKGINSRWRSPEGHLFEVQFHTPESFEAKQLTHGAYERIRNTRTTGVEVAQLKDFQREVSAGIPTPTGALDIPNFRRMES